MNTGPWTIDVLDLLPDGWAADMRGLCLDRSVRIQRSVEDDPDHFPGTTPLDYRVVTGEIIRAELPWLHAFYTSDALRQRVEALVGEPVEANADLVAGLNLNLLAGEGGHYQWHRDIDPYTMVLFASTHGEHDGGELEMQLPGGGAAVFSPKAGAGVVFDGLALPHRVKPLRSDVLRLTLVLEFYKPGREAKDLNKYLYGKAG